MAVARAALEALERRVRRCIDAGLLGKRASMTVAFAFHATCQGLASIEIMGWLAITGEPPLETWNDTLRALLEGYRTTPSRPTTKADPPARKRSTRARQR